MDAKWEERAAELFKDPAINCAQAVIIAVCEKEGIDPEIYKKISSGMAAGLATRENACGALLGAAVSAGILTDGKDTKTVMATVAPKFKELTGAYACKDIKGIETGKMLCSCDDCVKNGIKALSAAGF